MPHYPVFSQIIAHSQVMQQLRILAKKFAQLDVPLLITGETGVGKDLFALACVGASLRKNKKFIAINCAGLPKEEAESEMFGHIEKEGQSNQGFFEYAQGGTVLLDGITELPLSLQAKLLRFLTDGTFRRVGEDKAHYADVRVICTAQIPLSEAVSQGKLREDLYHRLNVLSLHIPPLRQRVQDIEPLAIHFMSEIGQKLHRRFSPLSPQFIEKLSLYSWRGNGRELYNTLYRMCSLSEDGELKAEDLQLHTPPASIMDWANFENKNLEEMMHAFEAHVLRHFYQQYPTTRKLAGRLGISHTAIANKLKQYDIMKG